VHLSVQRGDALTYHVPATPSPSSYTEAPRMWYRDTDNLRPMVHDGGGKGGDKSSSFDEPSSTSSQVEGSGETEQVEGSGEAKAPSPTEQCWEEDRNEGLTNRKLDSLARVYLCTFYPAMTLFAVSGGFYGDCGTEYPWTVHGPFIGALFLWHLLEWMYMCNTPRRHKFQCCKSWPAVCCPRWPKTGQWGRRNAAAPEVVPHCVMTFVGVLAGMTAQTDTYTDAAFVGVAFKCGEYDLGSASLAMFMWGVVWMQGVRSWSLMSDRYSETCGTSGYVISRLRIIEWQGLAELLEKTIWADDSSTALCGGSEFWVSNSRLPYFLGFPKPTSVAGKLETELPFVRWF